MNCKYHKDRQSEYVCSICNHPICEDCMTTVHGRKVCNSCIEKKLFLYKTGQEKISQFWSFIFSLIPGCGQMYMGLMNRGLQLLTAFVVVFLLGVIIEEIIATLGIIVWFYSFFDSLNIRKQRLQGEAAADQPIFKMDIGQMNPKYAGIALVVLGGLVILKNMTSFLAHTVHIVFNNRVPTYWIYDIYRNVVPLGLFILGMILIRKSRKKEKIDLTPEEKEWNAEELRK